MLQLTIPQEKIEAAREYAKQITSTLKDLLNAYSSVTIERTVLRLLGIDGALADGTPLPNFLVDQLKEKNALDKGAAYWISNAMVSTGLTAQEVAENVKDGKIELTQIIQQPIEKTIKVMNELTDKMLAHIKKQKATRDEYFAKYGERNKPSLYVIVATGNIYEDALQARAAAKQGADIIAVIRSTAQSLLDYVPYGATTEGFGGTFATQENF
ncbi:MAG: lysine 5,6-aminomutase subunit alpha, partial [Candidatus Cloacimonetes bacterium]|nr:lysine 5,6-aminomutase subunit alpha [Candidatus Cloacimonadota bacterium]